VEDWKSLGNCRVGSVGIGGSRGIDIVVGVGTVDGGGNVEFVVGSLHGIGIEFVVCIVDLVGGWTCVVVVVVGNMVVVVVVGNKVVVVVVGNTVVVVVVGYMAVASGDRPNRTGQTQSFFGFEQIYPQHLNTYLVRLLNISGDRLTIYSKTQKHVHVL